MRIAGLTKAGRRCADMAATLGGWRVTQLGGRRRHSVPGMVLTFAVTKLNRRRERPSPRPFACIAHRRWLRPPRRQAHLRPTRPRRPETPHRHNPLTRRSPLRPTDGVINYPLFGYDRTPTPSTSVMPRTARSPPAHP